MKKDANQPPTLPKTPRPLQTSDTPALDTLSGFHSIRTRLRMAPNTVKTIFVDRERRDQRMRELMQAAKASNVTVTQSSAAQLKILCGDVQHQGVAAQVSPMTRMSSMEELMEFLADKKAKAETPAAGAAFILVLDGVTDPRNLGACLRVADGAGVDAVIAPKDHSAALNDVAAKTSAGASEAIPYILVTNLARALDVLVEHQIRVVGTDDGATQTLYQADLTGDIALVLGAEGEGMRRLTRERCDELVNIPMRGTVESLNVSVATGVVLYEAIRQRV